MTVHYRRRPLSRRDELGAPAVSTLAGVLGAAAAYYLTRLYLSREKLEGGDRSVSGRDDQPGLPSPGTTADTGH